MKHTFSEKELKRNLELYSIIRELEGKKGKRQTLEFTHTTGNDPKKIKNVIVAFGSYDPLTVAHTELFRKGIDAARNINRQGLDELVIISSISHYDKVPDLSKNSLIPDRIHALEGYVKDKENIAVAIFNDPYYVNLSRSIKEHYVNSDIFFVLGTDVFEKIIDKDANVKRGFDIRSLYDELFRNRFLVTNERLMRNPAKGYEAINVNSLLTKNCLPRQHLESIIPIRLFDKSKGIDFSRLSATMVRNMIAEGKDTSRFLDKTIKSFVDKYRLFQAEPLFYMAFAFARERFFEDNKNANIDSYVINFTDYVNHLADDEYLCRKEITLHYKK